MENLSEINNETNENSINIESVKKIEDLEDPSRHSESIEDPVIIETSESIENNELDVNIKDIQRYENIEHFTTLQKVNLALKLRREGKSFRYITKTINIASKTIRKYEIIRTSFL